MHPLPISVSRQIANRYLIVQLADQSYGLGLEQVREVVDLGAVVMVLQPPQYTQGFLTLGEEKMPVIDLRHDFNVAATLSSETRIVIAWHVTRGVRAPVALIVDAVGDVFAIDRTRVRVAPDCEDIDTSFLSGFCERNGGSIALLDLARLLTLAVAGTGVAHARRRAG